MRADAGGATISANASGLRSLARHLLVLAQGTVPSGRHIHLDQDCLERFRGWQAVEI